MRFTLYVNGMPFDGDTIKTKSLGGSESAGYYLAKELAKDHNVTVFSNTDKPGRFDGVTYFPIGQSTKKNPFGEGFEQYSDIVQTDVLIGQRVPAMFSKVYESKMNFWWSHDLALKRFQGQFNAQLWNVNRFLSVSEFHSKQIAETYGVKEDFLSVLPNGVDHSLYTGRKDPDKKLLSKTLLFSSRPERGLLELVQENGVMEQLQRADPEIRLIVCCYDNTQKGMEQLYNYCFQRCKELPNVEFYGAKTKQELAVIEQNAWLQVYPTQFEETSCITAMNTQAAGTPFVAGKYGALPETLNGGGVYWVDKFDPSAFAETIYNASKNPIEWRTKHSQALSKGQDYGWDKSAEIVVDLAEKEFKKATSDKHRVLKHLVHYSDITAAKIHAERTGIDSPELAKYDKLFNSYQSYYEQAALNLVDRVKKISLGNWDFMENDARIKPMSHAIKLAKEGAKVLDYGCWLGQQTSYYAKCAPTKDFIGVDIVKNNVEEAQKFVDQEGIKNVKYVQAKEPEELHLLGFKYDLIILGEVLEHIIDPVDFLKQIEGLCNEGARIVLSVPTGISDDYIGHKQFNELPQHIHRFEVADLMEMIGRKKQFNIDVMSYGRTDSNELRASTVITWLYDKDNLEVNPIDYDRKLSQQCPRETLTACIITKPDGDTLAKTLKTIQPITDQYVIGIDGEENEGRAWQIAREYGAEVFKIESPLKSGFDVARNTTIQRATCDWIMWIDDDEQLEWPDRFSKYLKQNQYDSYAIHQHHFSAEPAGIIKSDWPCRVFRNHIGAKFFGVVHEHPELELNKGCGHTFLTAANEVAIMHNGYDTEDVRRKRFARNWDLMIRDREKYPTRELAKFLWIRDLVHMNRFELEQNGSKITEEMKVRAKEAVDMWRELVKQKKYRLLRDSIEYYSEAVSLLTGGGGMAFETGCRANIFGMGDKINGSAMPTIRAKFLDVEDVKSFSAAILEEKLNPLIGQRYL